MDGKSAYEVDVIKICPHWYLLTLVCRDQAVDLSTVSGQCVFFQLW